MKTFLLCCSLLVCSTFLQAQSVAALYIQKYDTLAQQLSVEYEIPTSVILAVALVESGAGTSKLAVKFHNHFGITGKNYNSMKLLGYKSRFKEYENDSLSYRHFCEVIKNKNLYLTTKGNPNPNVWFKRISKTGYAASASKWYTKMVTTVQRYDLKKYDVAFTATPVVEPIKIDSTGVVK